MRKPRGRRKLHHLLTKEELTLDKRLEAQHLGTQSVSINGISDAARSQSCLWHSVSPNLYNSVILALQRHARCNDPVCALSTSPKEIFLMNSKQFVINYITYIILVNVFLSIYIWLIHSTCKELYFTSNLMIFLTLVQLLKGLKVVNITKGIDVLNK